MWQEVNHYIADGTKGCNLEDKTEKDHLTKLL